MVSNSQENFHPLCPVVTAAPLSHRTDLKRMFDIELDLKSDHLEIPCLAQTKLIQPIAKKDLSDFQGTISDPKKEELFVAVQRLFGMEDEEEC